MGTESKGNRKTEKKVLIVELTYLLSFHYRSNVRYVLFAFSILSNLLIAYTLMWSLLNGVKIVNHVHVYGSFIGPISSSSFISKWIELAKENDNDDIFLVIHLNVTHMTNFNCRKNASKQKRRKTHKNVFFYRLCGCATPRFRF